MAIQAQKSRDLHELGGGFLGLLEGTRFEVDELQCLKGPAGQDEYFVMQGDPAINL